MNRILLLVGLTALAGVLSGCAKSRSELDTYIAEIKQRPGQPLPPLPKMQQFETFEYAAQDMRDPFARVSSEQRDEADAVTAGSGPRPDRTRRKEELESFPLDALDMVGTMGSEAEIFGLVKDPTGVVHRVRPSNFLGQNDGKILGIYEDRIELVELFPNGLGGWEERRSAIALDDE
jgi:type IV pilus assembly protein PilP